MRVKFWPLAAIAASSLALVFCATTEDAGGRTEDSGEQVEEAGEAEEENEEPAAELPPPPSLDAAGDEMALWVDGPHLRGANIYQRRVYPELDGLEYRGPGPVGAVYTQEDFDHLSELGANYVNISHPGLFTETPPYVLDEGAQENLDHLLTMITSADMFAVISFRTGPGRSEFTFFWGEDGDWFDASYYNDTVWEDSEAQDAWVEMWRYTTERYRDNLIVVGYDLMVEPNSNEVWLDVWDQDEFYSDYGGTLYDWNQFYPRIVDGIREVDPETPILVGGMGYSAVDWLPYVALVDDPNIVYTAHQYAPHVYTHQEPPAELTYPGTFDTDWDGLPDSFDRDWLEDLLWTVDDFSTTHGVPVAVNEFGVVRWVPGAADFMNDEMDLFEEMGANYAMWAWDPSAEVFVEVNNAFNFRLGPDPDNLTDTPNDLLDAITAHWGRNSIRPSSVGE
jgi:hypothetical protein